MLTISTIDSYQSNAVVKEIVTSAKTVHMKDISIVKNSLKSIENQIVTFLDNLNNPTVCRRPDSHDLKYVLAELDKVKGDARQLLDKMAVSTYKHHASKNAKLEKIGGRIAFLSMFAKAKFYDSVEKRRYMRESEERRRANQAESEKYVV